MLKYLEVGIQSGIVRPERVDLNRSRLRAGGQEQPSVGMSATGHGMNVAAGATRLTRT